MKNKVWNLIDSKTLVYSAEWVDAQRTIQASTFGKMVELARDRISYYHSDLYHDALWIEKTLTGPMKFDWIICDSGTFIGETVKYLKEDDWRKSVRYRFEIWQDGDKKWMLNIYEATLTITKIVSAPINPVKRYWGTEEADPFVDSSRNIPTLRNDDSITNHPRKEIKMDDYIQELRDKLRNAQEELDIARDKFSELQDYVYGLKEYTDELDSYIDSIDSAPEFEGSFDYDSRFNSGD